MKKGDDNKLNNKVVGDKKDTKIRKENYTWND